MNNGFITLHRKIQDNPIYKNTELFHLFVTLLLLASHESHRFLWNGKDTEIKRGQLITGTSALSLVTGQNPRTIYDRLRVLESLGMITRKSNNKFSLITIVKYSEYQDKKTKPTNEPQTNHKPSTTYNNDNNVNNDNKDTTADLKSKLFANPLMAETKAQFPHRNYDYQFALMCDWWLTNKKKLPQHISAFTNWLKNTQPDEALQAENHRKLASEALAAKQLEMSATPKASQEKINAIKQGMGKIGKPL